MNYKEVINEKGLKIKWIAKKIECNYASLRVYLHNQKLMPLSIEEKLKDILS